MSVLALPMAPAGSVQEQVTQQYAYLVQMAQQLNLALGQLEALGGGGNSTSAGGQLPEMTVDEVRRKLKEAIDKYYEKPNQGGTNK